MRWEHSVPSEFEKAVKEHGLCIVPTGSLERHGEHLPFGCDLIIAHTVACKAAELEPAVVFPPQYMMQAHESSCFSGTVNFPQSFAIEAFSLLLKSIAANGFKKILVVNAHGGNSHMLDYFAMSRLDEDDGYTFYQTTVSGALTEQEQKTIDSLWESYIGGHACEMETSLFMACCPDKTKLELTPGRTIKPMNRFARLKEHGVISPLWWYADFPDNVTGNASYAGEEKGKIVLDIYAKSVARAIKAVKEDKTAPELRQEFITRVNTKGTHKTESF